MSTFLPIATTTGRVDPPVVIIAIFLGHFVLESYLLPKLRSLRFLRGLILRHLVPLPSMTLLSPFCTISSPSGTLLWWSQPQYDTLNPSWDDNPFSFSEADSRLDQITLRVYHLRSLPSENSIFSLHVPKSRAFSLMPTGPLSLAHPLPLLNGRAPAPLPPAHLSVLLFQCDINLHDDLRFLGATLADVAPSRTKGILTNMVLLQLVDGFYVATPTTLDGAASSPLPPSAPTDEKTPQDDDKEPQAGERARSSATGDPSGDTSAPPTSPTADRSSIADAVALSPETTPTAGGANRATTTASFGPPASVASASLPGSTTHSDHLPTGDTGEASHPLPAPPASPPASSGPEPAPSAGIAAPAVPSPLPASTSAAPGDTPPSASPVPASRSVPPTPPPPLDTSTPPPSAEAPSPVDTTAGSDITSASRHTATAELCPPPSDAASPHAPTPTPSCPPPPSTSPPVGDSGTVAPAPARHPSLRIPMSHPAPPPPRRRSSSATTTASGGAGGSSISAGSTSRQPTPTPPPSVPSPQPPSSHVSAAEHAPSPETPLPTAPSPTPQPGSAASAQVVPALTGSRSRRRSSGPKPTHTPPPAPGHARSPSALPAGPLVSPPPQQQQQPSARPFSVGGGGRSRMRSEKVALEAFVQRFSEVQALRAKLDAVTQRNADLAARARAAMTRIEGRLRNLNEVGRGA